MYLVDRLPRVQRHVVCPGSHCDLSNAPNVNAQTAPLQPVWRRENQRVARDDEYSTALGPILGIDLQDAPGPFDRV